MNKILCISLFLALAAYGQQQERIAVMHTVDNLDSVSVTDLGYLTNRLRDIASKVLPKSRYGIMTQQSIVDRLGSQERAEKECREATCLADLGRKISADYISQGRIGRFSGKLTIEVELYRVHNSNLVGAFTGDSKDIEGLLAIIEAKAPKLFEDMSATSLLEVKPPDYIDGIGNNTQWSLSVNGKSHPFGAIRLSPGDYAVNLSHVCYENIDFNASVKGDSVNVFNMADHAKLKKGDLVLSAERGGKPASEPVFVNGNLAGQTPFSGSVPLCSRIEIDNEPVNVKLVHNERVAYTHSLRVQEYGGIQQPEVKLSDEVSASFWVAIAFDVVGAGFIINSLIKNSEANDWHGKYSSLDYRAGASEFNGAWDKAEKAELARDVSAVLGSLFLAAGIGVHIWF
jgi:hypothetical protein